MKERLEERARGTIHSCLLLGHPGVYQKGSRTLSGAFGESPVRAVEGCSCSTVFTAEGEVPILSYGKPWACRQALRILRLRSIQKKDLTALRMRREFFLRGPTNKDSHTVSGACGNYTRAKSNPFDSAPRMQRSRPSARRSSSHYSLRAGLRIRSRATSRDRKMRFDMYDDPFSPRLPFSQFLRRRLR